MSASSQAGRRWGHRRYSGQSDRSCSGDVRIVAGRSPVGTPALQREMARKNLQRRCPHRRRQAAGGDTGATAGDVAQACSWMGRLRLPQMKVVARDEQSSEDQRKKQFAQSQPMDLERSGGFEEPNESSQ
jgi:hypothetical protein